MLRSLDEIHNYGLEATDGQIGRCSDFLFSEDDWTVRYMVADTERWLPGRRVLIAPIAFQTPQERTKQFPLSLTKSQIESSPPLASNATISRKYEEEYFAHYGWSVYWTKSPGIQVAKEKLNERGPSAKYRDSQLRSVREVKGYEISATDGDFGRVKDFIVDHEDWKIRFVVVDTRRWLPGGDEVLLSPEWISGVRWAPRQITVDVTKDLVKDSPKFDPSTPVNREYEIRLYDYYGRPKYWEAF